MLYHENQVAALCGVHCINTLLQGPYFNELDLAQIGHDLDQLERQMLDPESQAAAGPSCNLDESGMFSVQVLTRALQVWHLTAIPTDNKELRQAGFEPQKEEAFICNLQEHWFTIRKIGSDWWNFNSLYPAPEHLSAFYLTAYLDSLKQQGYTIFVIRGQLPAQPASPGASLDGPGKWWEPEQARAAHKEAQDSRQLGRARHAMEDAFARAAAAGGAISLRSLNKRPASGSAEVDDEDADLAAAIAASMQDCSGAAGGGSSSGGAGPSYAAVARHAAQSQAAATAGGAGEGAGDAGLLGSGNDDADFFEDDDPELAAALAASLEEHQQQLQQQADEQEQRRQQEAVEIPAEPAEGAEGAVTVAFRLPSGGRLSRRFNHSDSVAGLQAWVKQQLIASGEMQARQLVQLATQFPKKLLQPELDLNAAGVEDRSMLSVQLS